MSALAREKGALSLVDGAQAFGVLDVDLSTIKTARCFHYCLAMVSAHRTRPKG